MRFAKDETSLVTAPPYDVISPEQRERYAAVSPRNFVHVSLPRKALSGVPDYSAAGDLWRDWTSTGVVEKSTQDSLYLYRADVGKEAKKRTVAGIIGCIELSPFGEGDIYPHEKTRPGPKQDRLELMKATHANLEPLWFLSTVGLSGISDAVAIASESLALAEVTDDQGVTHRIWPLERDVLNALDIPDGGLVVADGHHRYETAVAYRDLRREVDGRGPWDYTLALVMDPRELAPLLLPIHRVTSASPDQVGELVELSAVEFDVQGLTAFVADKGPGTIGMIHRSGAWTLRSEPLDTAFLAESVLAPLDADVAYEHDLGQVQKALDDGRCCFILAPIDTSEVTRTAAEGGRMPPKTTLFWPKPLSGLVMRDLSRPTS